MVVSYRLGWDIDGDRFINWGVSEGTPLNLFPGALYTEQSSLVGIQGSTESYEDVKDISEHGFMKRQIKLGSDIDGVYADSIRLGQPDVFAPYMQRLGDPDNLISNVLDWDIPGLLTNSVVSTGAEPFTATVKRWLLDTVSTGTFKRNYLLVGHSADYLTIPGSNYADKYYDAGLDWTRSVSAVPSWGGIPVVAGQNYTLIFQMRKDNNNLGVRIYGNGGGVVASPEFGRQLIARVDYPDVSSTLEVTPQYIQGQAVNIGDDYLLDIPVVINFTAPAGCTHIAIDIPTDWGNTTHKVYIGGLMLLNGTVSDPGRLWDSVVGLEGEESAISIPVNTDATLSFWVKSDDGIDGLDGTYLLHELNGTARVEGASSYTVTSEWTRCNLYIPSQTYPQAIMLEWTATKGGVPTAFDNVGTVQFRGFMLTEGTELWPYHAGAGAGYEDITDYTLSVNTQSGKKGFHEALAYEGTMDVTVNNETKIFSPENVASPYHGVLDQTRLAVLQVFDGTEWRSLWSGWSSTIEMIPGENGSNRATLSCVQGLFRLREGSFSAPVTENTTMDALVPLLVESSGWRGAAVPYSSSIGYNTRAGENFYVLDVAEMFGSIDPGVIALELVGQDWGRKTTIEAALKELLEAENASFWLDRDGRIVVVNREYWINEDTPVEVIIDSDVQQATYTYAKDIVNRSEVIINRKRVQEDQSIWKTHRAFKVIPHRLPTDQVQIEIHAERVEGRTKTVINYSLENMTKTVYLADPGPEYNNTSAASQAIADKVSVELIPVSGGNLYRLHIINRNSAAVWVDIELRGSMLDTEDGTPIIMENEDAIMSQEAVHTFKATTGVLDKEEQARSMGMFYILRDAYARGEFTSIEIRNEALDADLDQLFELQIGTKVSITEAQTAQEDVIHWIIGENISIEGNTLTVVYNTARTIEGDFFKVGGVVNNQQTNIIEDWTNVETVYGNTAEFDGEKLAFKINVPTPLYLDPSPGQVVRYPTGRWHAGVLRPLNKLVMPPTGYDETHMVYNASGSNLGSYATTNGVIPTTPPISLIAGAKYRLHLSGTTYPEDWVVVDSDGSNIATAMTVTQGGFTYPSYGANMGYYQEGEWTTPAALIHAAERSGFIYTDDTDIGSTFPTRSPHVGSPYIVRMVDNRNTLLDPTQSYVYSLFARKNAADTEPVTLVLTVYDIDGAVIGSDTILATTTVQKWEVAIPSGNTAVWAELRRTPVGQDSVTALIYGYGISLSSVTSYTDLQQDANPSIIYA